jgi:tetratricopeptide (TPR) repeat protein
MRKRSYFSRLGISSVGAVAWILLATTALSQPGGGPTPKPAQPAPAPSPAPAPAPAPAPTTGAPAPAPKAAPKAPGSRRNERVPAIPPPTPEQIAALAELQKEADEYAADAKEYRSTLTRIIKHHYEEKRRRILTALDREIATEQKGLKAAREEAIKRLEAFVAKYTRPNDDPQNTPDAMFRLAALYEERGREAADEYEPKPGEPPPVPDLKQAIALYKTIIQTYPAYNELSGVYYYLGHALNDEGRLEEAQQVWRALVCQNHFAYPVPPDPQDPSKDSIARMPQDHDTDFWLSWMSRHPEPRNSPSGESTPAPKKAPPAGGAEAATDDEDTYRDPFPSTCMPLPQKPEEGEDPRYLAEVWWRIGDYHFEEIDPQGGPYNLNRAESAYRQSMNFKKPPVFGVAMYKLAWTFYKQQRYRTAVEQFVELLKYTDEQEKETGNPGADFRAEAYAYIAGSLTYLDFEGAGPNDPYIARNDVFDLESDAAVIETKMHVAIDRVQDPALIPQDKKWTVEIYKALAFEFREYNHFHNLIDLNELILAKWPMHRDAPMVQHQIAETYEELAAQATSASEKELYSKKALEARGKLVDYVATPGKIPPWVEANKEDPEAIRRAEQLVRGGLRRAAADHTNAGRSWVARARGADDPAEKQEAFETALEEYRLAAKAWGGYLLQDENAEDAYESRFWLADAYTNSVLITTQLGRDPDPEEVKLALQMARDVRDSNEDDKYLQPAAMMVVRIPQQIVALNYERSEEGKGGFPKRSELKTQGEGDDVKPVVEEPPQAINEMVVAFDEYIARVPIEHEPNQEKPNHHRFAYLAGEIPFLYGQFAEAKRRLNPIYVQQCGKTEYGYLAWEKLLTMANIEGDFASSEKLSRAAQKKSCAFTEEQKLVETNLSSDTIKTAFYKEAAAAYKKAKEMPDGPDRKKQWRRAAELYDAALKEAPDRKEAPEAAILGANAYKQIGEYDKAIAMYELFIKEYGNDKKLEEVKKGDPAKKVPPNEPEYKERVGYLKTAYEELANANILFFNYKGAAQTYDKIADVGHFDGKDRRAAAYNAVSLYGKIGERTKMEAAKTRFYTMSPTGEEKAEIEWVVAELDLKAWDPGSPDKGANKDARVKATRSMDAYYRNFSTDAAANKFSVNAAYHAARTRRLGGEAGVETWCKNTITAWEKYKGTAGNDEKGNNKALGGDQADMAAECEYRAIDEDIKKNFDYDAGHHRYKGVITTVRKDFKDDFEKGAKGYYDKLQVVIDKYSSRPWAVAARARQGSLYDSCRTGLYFAEEPAVKLFDDKEEKLLKQLDDLCANQGSQQACDQYDAITAKRRTDWRQTKDQDLGAADLAMTRGYVEAILWAKAWKVRVDAVDHAISRLAFMTPIIGDAKLKQYSDGVQDPGTKSTFVYSDGMFLRMRRGLSTEVEVNVLPSPLPVIPAP